MPILLISMCKETGACPRCGRPATFEVDDFDSRMVCVACAGGCRLRLSKSALDDLEGSGGR
jgi:hypothetical protein